MRITYEESLAGRSVIDSTGRVIGELSGLILETDSWSIEALRVKLRKDVTKEMGVSHGAFRAASVDVPVDYVQNVSDTLVLKGPIGSLRTLETRAERPR
jgi:sporulation protein YlmC with PRC-barrel domain